MPRYSRARYVRFMRQGMGGVMSYPLIIEYKRIAGNWVLEWSPERPHTIFIHSNHEFRIRRSQSAIQYHDGTFGYDHTPDKNLEKSVAKFMRDIRAGVAV